MELKALEKQLETARSDLVAAQATLDRIVAGEAAASETEPKYVVWRSARDRALVDVQRTIARLNSLSASFDEARQREADVENHKAIETCRRLNSDVGRRLRGEGPRLSTDMLTLVSAATAAVIEAERLNGMLPPGVEPILDANFLARGSPTIDRKHIEEKIVTLWAFASTKNLVGDQDAVVATGDTTGILDAGRGVTVACIKRRYRQTRYQPAVPASHPSPLYSELVLPCFDQAGLAFDGTRLTPEQVVGANILPPPRDKTQRRPIEIELEPIEEDEPELSPFQKVFAKLNAERAG